MTKRVRHTSGTAFEAPDDWEIIDNDDAALVVIEPEHDGRFRANLVLTVLGADGLSFRDWQSASDAMLADTLADYLLLDLEKLTVAGLPGGRRLAHHLAANGDALVMEQWFTSRDDVGYTLTATVDTLRYDAAADELASYGTSLRLPEDGA